MLISYEKVLEQFVSTGFRSNLHERLNLFESVCRLSIIFTKANLKKFSKVLLFYEENILH